MWSTQSAVRNQHGYSLYNISKRSEHAGIILSMDVINKLENGKKAITGSTDCCIKIWNVGPCEIVSEKTYRYAHTDAVTDIACKPDSEFCFLSCSKDKNISLWDYRMSIPVVDWYEGEYAYNTVTWSTDHTQILAGNHHGDIHVFDSRTLKTILRQVQGFDHNQVHKIKANSDNDNLVAILGQSNVVKVFDIKNDFNLIYENKTANDFVRDVQWCRDDRNKFYTVGWDKEIAVHTVST